MLCRACQARLACGADPDVTEVIDEGQVLAVARHVRGTDVARNAAAAGRTKEQPWVLSQQAGKGGQRMAAGVSLRLHGQQALPRLLEHVFVARCQQGSEQTVSASS